jgi:hypothetical protein
MIAVEHRSIAFCGDSTMAIANEAVSQRKLLTEMYADDYFPPFLVDKIKAILLNLCEQIERERPTDDAALLRMTHAATERINGLADEFDENDSELETVAREIMGEEFAFIARVYGFEHVDVEDLIAPRDW